jgi:hypothetical protein
MSTQFKSEYDNETPDQWAVITASDLGELRQRVAEAARTTPKGKMREVAAASRSVVTMIEVAREQGVSQRRLAIQMILQAGLMLGAKTFRREAWAFVSDVAVCEAMMEQQTGAKFPA